MKNTCVHPIAASAMYDNFLFRKSWWDIIKQLPSEQRSEVIDYITQYIFEGIEPQFEEMTAVTMAVQFIIREINADKERYDSITEKRRESGKLGGAPKGNQNARKNKQNKQVDFENNQKQANKQNKPIDIEEEIEYNSSSSSSSSSPHARERLTQWVAESGLTDWAKQQCLRKGCKTEIDIGTLLDEFFDNDFTVRERCERNERTEVLKHLQNWLPKYLTKLKNENNNEQQHRNTTATADSTPADTVKGKPYSRISQLANTEFDID